MKIQLTRDEQYEIKLPEQVTMAEFQSITAKFNFLIKNFSKFNLGVEEQSSEQDEILIEPSAMIPNQRTTYAKQDKEKWRRLRDNRSMVVNILKAYYTKDNDGFEEELKRQGVYFSRGDMSTTAFKIIRDMHKITPKEIGIPEFSKFKCGNVVRGNNKK